MATDLFKDFWAGYNYGNNRQPQNQVQERQDNSDLGPETGRRIQQVRFETPRTYDTSKFTRMQGPNGEQGTVYPTGKMYILNSDGSGKVRTFGSRPYAVSYMEKRGWIIV